MISSQFQHIGLIGKYLQNPSHAADAGTHAQVLRDVVQCMQTTGAQVSMETATARHAGLADDFSTLNLADFASHCDLAVVVGGDGTMLSAARQLAPARLPLIGINQGRLGFVTDIALDTVHTVLPPMLGGAFTEDQRSLLQAQVVRNDTVLREALALNDVVINRGSTSGMVELRIEVDGHFVCNQRADGLIVATSTGSTAYALSAGGALMHPAVAGWIMVPIAPHTLSNRPIVISENSRISIELVDRREASANFDSQSNAQLQQGDRVLVQRSPLVARFLHPLHWNYFDTLREKLHWNKGSA